MVSLLQRLIAGAFSVILVVLSAWAQEGDVLPVPTESSNGSAPREVKATVTIETGEKEIVIKKSSRRSRSSATRTTYDDIVMFGGAPVWIKQGESAREVVAFGNDVQVDGAVNGNLVVMFGDVRLGPGSRLANGPVVIGGNLISEPGAKLGLNPTVLSLSLFGGMTNVVSAAFVEASRRWFTEGVLRARPLPPRLPAAWLASAFLGILFVLIGVVFQKPVTSTVTRLDEGPGSAFLVGLLVCALTFPVFLLLVVSLVGVVLVPFLACALAVMFVIGKVALYRYAGQTLGTQLGFAFFRNPLLALLLGMLLFYGAYSVPVIGAAVWLLAIPLGVGAVTLAGFRRRPVSGPAEGAGLGVPIADVALEAHSAPAVLLARAGFWIRLLATFLDLLLVGLLVAVLFRQPKWFLLVWTVYHLVLWSWKGSTVGGIIVGLRIVQTDGGRLSILAAVVRVLGSFFSGVVVGLGFFWAGWTASRQSWHDKIAGTVVVRLPRTAAHI